MRLLKQYSLALALLVASVGLHFFGLSNPSEVVFDEVHFGKFVTAYCCTHERFFDIHPPHAKLLISGGAYLLGYRGGFTFESIGQAYGDISVATLRAVPALFGALIPLLAFTLLRQTGVSGPLSFLGACLFLFNNAFLLQSRLIALDSILLVATLGSVSAFLAGMRQKGKTFWIYMALAGGLAGLALGTKFTGLAALGMLGLLVIYRCFTRRTTIEAKKELLAGVIILVSALAIYLFGWWLHYALLENPGDGDAWQVPTGNFLADVTGMHRTMLNANYNLTATHPYSSSWWSWPLMLRPVFYWQGASGGALYFIGNPVVWWGGAILFLISVATMSFGRIAGWFRTQKNESGGYIFLLGFVIAYLPFVRVPRALFLYHYMMPLAFGILFGLWCIHVALKKNRQLRTLLVPWYGFSLLVILGGFILFSPLTFGFSAANWQDALYWLPTWR